MPKRKRSTEEAVADQLDKSRADIARALKAAKGFERQRLAKRLADSAPDKVKRLHQEILVLKSLDLQQVANAHLCASLLRVKTIADAPGIPPYVKRGIAKPDISEEERIALHNVTSSLYNRKEVRTVVEKAVSAVADALGVAVPNKRSKGRERPKKSSEQEADAEAAKRESAKERTGREPKRAADGTEDEAEPESDVEEEKGANLDAPQEVELDGFSGDDAEEEKAMSRYEAMLGGSSSDEDGDDEDEGEEATMSKYQALLGSDSDDDSEGHGQGSDDEGDSQRSFSGSSSPAPPPSLSPAPQPKSRPTRAAQGLKPQAGDSTFLPSLMGGYISGSESASDIDVAPPPRKNRRGQQARQAIWEKKYGDKAKHLTSEKKGRDAGWDAKRGAVDGGDSRPWKRGIHNPLDRRTGGGGTSSGVGDRPGGGAAPAARAPRQRDDARSKDTGPLHPSWEAKKKAKAAQQTAAFAGKKTTFD